MIGESLARRIVLELEQVLDENINIMNKDGLIIASRDEKRIGTFHEGALNVIKETRQVSVYPSDQLLGSKQGVNMPIVFHGKLVGVIGITGHPDEVGAYGKIIKKMTEVLMSEDFARRELQLEARTKKIFFNEWLAQQWSDEEEFRLRGKTLTIDVDIHRYAILFQIHETNCQPFASEIQRQEWLDKIREKLRQKLTSHHDDLSFTWKSDQFVILKYSEQKEQELINHVMVVIKKLVDQGDHLITCGMGRNQTGLQGIVQSFEEAEQAHYFTGKKQVSFIAYRDLGIESLVHHIPADKQEDFIQRFFSFFYQEEHRDLVNTLRVYFATHQSITKTSKALFIHKNTVQYRLKKMVELSSFDPRIIQEAALYIVALALYDSRS